METYYWNPTKSDETARMAEIWSERVETQAFTAWRIAVDDKSGKLNGLRGEKMESFDPDAGGMILIPVGKV